MAPQTLDLPFIDESEVFGPSFAVPQTISLPFIDSSAVFPPTIQQADIAAVELIVDGIPVTTAFARRFENQLADTGSFSFQMLRSDFLASPIGFDVEVAFVLDGTVRFLGNVEALDHAALAQGEGAEQVVTVSGRSALGELDQHIIGPSRGLNALPIEDVRSLSWVSPDFSATAAGWPLAKVVNLQKSYADTGAPRPHIWPDITGKWIWGNVPGVTALDAPQGICLFREAFTLGDNAVCRFFFAGDNVMRLWIDGAEITWFAGSAVGRYAEIELSAGGHYIAAKVANKVDVPGEDNPAGFICVGYTVTGSGLLGTKITETDGTWRCLPYPVRAPGFTDGKAVRLFMEEASLSWGRDFDDFTDSDGQPWTYQREIAVNTGRSILEFLRERSDYAIDFAYAPGGRILRMWNHGGRGIVRDTTLQQTSDPATSDFLSLSHSGKRTRVNKMLIRYADGHTQAEDLVSQMGGERDGYLELGHVFSEEEAQEIATALMVSRTNESYSTTATLHPHDDAATPFKGFEVGDWITCPDENDDDVSMRVNSITWAEDEDGVVDYPVQLRDVHFEMEERNRVWLRRMADGVLVGGASVSSRRGTPAPTAQVVTVLKVAEFSFDNVELTTSTSPRRPAEESGNIVQVFGELTTAGSGTTAVEVRLNGSVLTTLNFGAGDTEDSKAINIVPIRANVDKLQCEITVAGSGAEGLDIQVRAI